MNEFVTLRSKLHRECGSSVPVTAFVAGLRFTVLFDEAIYDGKRGHADPPEAKELLRDRSDDDDE